MDGTAFSTITPDLSLEGAPFRSTLKKVTIQVELQHLRFWFWGSLTPPISPHDFFLGEVWQGCFFHMPQVLHKIRKHEEELRWTGVAMATSTDSRNLEEKYPSDTPGDDYSKPSTLIPFTGLIYHRYLHTYLCFTSCWCINNTYSYVYIHIYVYIL